MVVQDEHQPASLEYEPVPPRVTYAPRFNGWWIILAMLPPVVYLHLGQLLSTSNYSSGGLYAAALWASLAIGARAVVGIVRRERSWTWLVYVPLYYFLPVIAREARDWAFKLGW
jgi:hypothetical protein